MRKRGIQRAQTQLLYGYTGEDSCVKYRVGAILQRCPRKSKLVTNTKSKPGMRINSWQEGNPTMLYLIMSSCTALQMAGDA